MVDSAIVESVRTYLRALRRHGVPVSGAVIYGSSARGQMQQWSDIDLVVLCPRYDEALSRADVDLLWQVAARSDNRIEPVACGLRRWSDDTGTPLLEIARREGYLVELDE
jgi:predicted nucleotidyltransferase